MRLKIHLKKNEDLDNEAQIGTIRTYTLAQVA